MPPQPHSTPPQPHASDCTCHACKIEPLVRNHYYTGRLLTAQDFNAEQQYHRDKQRLHNVMLHGWGVVCGLQIVPDDQCPERYLLLKAGFALDSCGREIRVVEDFKIDLHAYLTFPPKPRCTCTGGEHGGHGGEGHPAPAQATTPTQTQTPPAQAPHCPPPVPDVYQLIIRICHHECKSNYQPAPFDECGCDPKKQQPNLVRENFTIKVTHEKVPAAPTTPVPGEDHGCGDILASALDHCETSPDESGCLTLAIILPYNIGDYVIADRIKDQRTQIALPSTAALSRTIRCILDRIPTRRLTHVREMNWEHGKEYSHNEFRKHFVNPPEGKPGGFFVWFSGELHPLNPLDPWIFEPTVLRRHHDTRWVRISEIPDAQVERKNHDGLRLWVEPEYWHHLLNSCHRFRIFLRLRCNLLLDRAGQPIDGNLFARIQDGNYHVAPPTGDGSPGGLFESWITVNPSIGRP